MTEESKAESYQDMSGPAYRVKVRATHCAFEFGGEMIDQAWRELPVLRHRGIGVTWRRPEYEVSSTYEYHAAVALAAWFLNEAGWHQVEVKLVEYKLVVHHELHKVGEMELEDAIGFMFKKASTSQNTGGK